MSSAGIDRWRRALLLGRICELHTARLNAFSVDSVVVQCSPEEVYVAVKRAIAAFEDGDLDRAEAACVKAEEIICAMALPHPPRSRPPFGMARPASPKEETHA